MRKSVKSWLAIGTAAIVAAGLAGCSGSSSSDAPAAEASKTETSAEAEKADTAESKEESKNLEGEIEIVTNANEQTYNAVNEILEQFMQENPASRSATPLRALIMSS